MRECKKDDNKITDCEQLVMKIVWRSEEDLCLMEIVDRVNVAFDKDWKPQTVSTFLGRLVKKGFVTMYRRGRQFYYHIVIAEKEYGERMIEECVDFWSDGDVSKLLVSLHSKRKLQKNEVDNLRRMIDELDT